MKPPIVRETLRRTLALMTGNPPVPREARGLGSALLHVSDTPSIYYPDLARLAKTVRPRFILHTGDLADEVKLCPRCPDACRYAAKVNALLGILLATSAERVFLVLGNHDDPAVVVALAAPVSGRIEVYEGCVRLDLEGVRIAAAHRAEDLWKTVADDPADFGFYGHDTSVLPPDADGRVYLNGNVKIRVLDLASRTVHSIDYPRSVHDARQKKRKIGL